MLNYVCLRRWSSRRFNRAFVRPRRIMMSALASILESTVYCTAYARQLEQMQAAM
jgi:hypothetical protein